MRARRASSSRSSSSPSAGSNPSETRVSFDGCCAVGTAAHGVSIHARLLDEGVVRQLREVTEAIFTWPVNRVDDAASLAALGVDGLISDAPNLLLAEGARS